MYTGAMWTPLELLGLLATDSSYRLERPADAIGVFRHQNIGELEQILEGAPESPYALLNAIIALGCQGSIEGPEALREYWQISPPDNRFELLSAVLFMLHQACSDHYDDIGAVIDEHHCQFGNQTWQELFLSREMVAVLSPQYIWIEKFMRALPKCRPEVVAAAHEMLTMPPPLMFDVGDTPSLSVLIDLGIAVGCSHTHLLMYARTAMMPILQPRQSPSLSPRIPSINSAGEIG